MTDLIAEARQDMRNIIRYLHPGEDKHRARAISSADTAVDRLRDEIERLRARVMSLGDMADCCVYDDIKIVCTYCRCKRRPVSSGQGTE